MFFKLARKNVTRSMRDYAIYFITLLFGVCVFYVFNSLENQWVMELLAEQNSDYVRAILQLTDVVSVFVSVVLAGLILYANTFLLRRRKRELGTYLLLGMGQKTIGVLLFAETMFIGFLALVFGLGLGFFLAQFLSAFTASLFQMTVDEFHFVFSWRGVGKTVLYFSVIFLAVMICNCVLVARQKLIRLLQAQRQNEQIRLRSVAASAVMFVLGVALLAVAYGLLLKRGLLTIDRIFWLMLALGTAGTLLFFRSLSGFLLRICQSRKGLYYQNLNMFVLRQFNAKINTNYLSMTVVCLLLLLAIGITACSVGVNSTVEGNVERTAPLDMTLRLDDDYFVFAREDLPDALEEAGFDPENWLGDFAVVCRYAVKLDEPIPLAEDGRELNDAYIMSLSDFNSLTALRGEKPLDLAPNTCGMAEGTEPESYGKPEREAWQDGALFSIGGHVYAPDPKAYHTGALYTSEIDLSDVIILPDEAMKTVQKDAVWLRQYYLAGDYAEGVDQEHAEELLWNVWDETLFDQVEERGSDPDGSSAFGLSLSTKQFIYLDTMGTKILVLFIGLYLGTIFLITSAAVLALQMLSQAADNVGRYRILRKLGVEEKMRDRSIDIQVFLYFFLPLLLAVVHSIVGIKAANDVIAEIGKLDAVASSTVTALIILVVYGAYFLATCWGSRRMVRER